MRAEQKHIARQALDREIFIDGADHFAFGLGDHGVCRAVGNGAAGRDRRELRAPPAAQPVIHLIAMQQRSAAAARRRDAFRQHRHYGFEIARATDCGRDTRCGPDRRDRASSQASQEVSATICCARISSAFCGISMRSRSPLRMA